MTTSLTASPLPRSVGLDALEPPATCLNCGAPLAGAYCAACGQRAIELTAPTWHVVKEALAEASDLDGRALRTARALVSPGQLTIEFLRGCRAPYFGPLKLFLLAGTVLTTTWITTRGVDAHYYQISGPLSTGRYINAVVRGSLAAGLAIAIVSWALDRGRRRLLDDIIFALHLVTALALLAAGVTWLGTLWKLAWGTAAATPPRLPSVVFMLFIPTVGIGLVYIIAAIRRVYGGPWWGTMLRAIVTTAVGLGAVFEVILHTG